MVSSIWRAESVALLPLPQLSSSEPSPQSSLPSQCFFCETHFLFLHVNCPALQPPLKEEEEVCVRNDRELISALVTCRPSVSHHSSAHLCHLHSRLYHRISRSWAYTVHFYRRYDLLCTLQEETAIMIAYIYTLIYSKLQERSQLKSLDYSIQIFTKW